MRAPDPVLRCRGLTKRYRGATAVDGVDLDVEAGEVHGLIGPNGSGKTTTLALVTGIVAADAGEVRICGERLSPRAHDVRRHVGFVPQAPSLHLFFTVEENLRFLGRLFGIRGRSLRTRVADALGRLDLDDRASTPVVELSPGLQRRASVAATLLHDPALVVMDEPTAGVDPRSRLAIEAIVRDLAGQGRAVVFASHHLAEVRRTCERLTMLRAGRCVATGPLDELAARCGLGNRVRLATEQPAAVADGCRALGFVAAAHESAGRVDVVLAGVEAGAVLVPLLAAVGGRVDGVEVVPWDEDAMFLELVEQEVEA